MKTLLRMGLATGLFFTALAPARAQAVANGGFETWATRRNIEAPAGWLTIDDLLAASPLGPVLLPASGTGTYTKTTDAHGGAYALRLESKAVTTLLGPVALPSAVALGNKANSNSDLGGGLPFTGRPTTLQFYYKLSGPQSTAANDGALAQVELTRTVNGRAETIATARQLLTTITSTYVLAQVPLTYTSAATPDSVRVIFGTSDPDQTNDATVGTVLQIDDVAFTGTVTAARDAALTAAISVFPNPSADGRYVLGAEPALLAAPLAVLDATGRVVRREAAPGRGAAAATRQLDLSDLPAGLYTVQLFTPRGLVTRQLAR